MSVWKANSSETGMGWGVEGGAWQDRVGAQIQNPEEHRVVSSGAAAAFAKTHVQRHRRVMLGERRGDARS